MTARCRASCPAGRSAVLHLLALAQSEVIRFPRHTEALGETLHAGGYLRIFDRELEPSDRLCSYVATYVERNVRRSHSRPRRRGSAFSRPASSSSACRRCTGTSSSSSSPTGWPWSKRRPRRLRRPACSTPLGRRAASVPTLGAPGRNHRGSRWRRDAAALGWEVGVLGESASGALESMDRSPSRAVSPASRRTRRQARRARRRSFRR